MRRRPVALTAIGLAILALNAAAIPVAIGERWPAAFGAAPDPDHVADQWIGTGTAVSAPVAPLVALVVFMVLAWLPQRPLRIVGGAGAAIVGLVFVIGTLGEPTTFRPESWLEEFFHVMWLVLALALITAAGWTVARDVRRETPRPA